MRAFSRSFGPGAPIEKSIMSSLTSNALKRLDILDVLKEIQYNLLHVAFQNQDSFTMDMYRHREMLQLLMDLDCDPLF